MILIYLIPMEYEPVIGLEIHAELDTRSKMFCACRVVDSTVAQPNIAVCPVCAGMPGVLPVVNQRAVEYGLRVALALGCQINPTSIFARKNYFYPDLPKGYQISQYEQPLARNGQLTILTSQGERLVRIRRVHLEEDTGKLTHVNRAGESYSLVDLNRAGVPLLEIVTEPDMHSAEEVRLYATALRSLLRYLGVNSGDMQKGVMRIEPNISVRPLGSAELGTRTEIKNLNSFRALERARGVRDPAPGRLAAPRGARRAGDRRLGRPARRHLHPARQRDRRRLPLLPRARPAAPGARSGLGRGRCASPCRSCPLPACTASRQQYGLSAYDAEVLVAERATADYYEQTVAAAAGSLPRWSPTGSPVNCSPCSTSPVRASKPARSPRLPWQRCSRWWRAARSIRIPAKPCWGRCSRAAKLPSEIVAGARLAPGLGCGGHRRAGVGRSGR